MRRQRAFWEKRPTATFGPIGRGTPAGDWVGGEAFQPRVAQRLGVSAVSRSAAVEFRCRRNPGTEDHGQRAGKPENIGQKFRAGNKQIGRAVHRIGETEMPRNRLLLAAVIGVLITVSAGGGAFAQKSGGISEYTAPTARRA